jgi:t-SNARE complex subunit (syntaxin)
MAADRRDNDATQALWQAREQAHADATRKLDGLDHDVAELRPKLEKALSTDAASTAVQDLQAKAAAVRKRILDLDQCSADDFESIRRSIHTGLADLEQALADAKKRV